jgi:hypothetical protein
LAGQHNIKENNQQNLFNKHNGLLMHQLDLWYIQDKLAIKTEYKEEEAVYNYLLKEVYKTENCEVINFLNKKLNGALGDENVDLVNLQSLQIKYRDINNYYYTSPIWTQEDW